MYSVERLKCILWSQYCTKYKWHNDNKPSRWQSTRPTSSSWSPSRQQACGVGSWCRRWDASLPLLRTAQKPPSCFRGCLWLCKGEMWSHSWALFRKIDRRCSHLHLVLVLRLKPCASGQTNNNEYNFMMLSSCMASSEQRRAASDLWIKSTVLSLESPRIGNCLCPHPSSPFYYQSSWKLILILSPHGVLKAELVSQLKDDRRFFRIMWILEKKNFIHHRVIARNKCK